MIRPVNWRSCHSMSEDIELEKLESWACELCELLGRDLRIIEIGSFHGKTTAILAQFGEVLAIDLFSNVDDGMASYCDIGNMHLDNYLQNMKRLELLVHRVHTMVDTSNSLAFLPNMEADLFFIDGDHHYEAVRQDILVSERHLAPGGLMVFHDFERPGYGFPPYNPEHPHHGPVDPWAGVAQAVHELLDRGEFVIHEHFLGIIAVKRSVN